MLRIEGSGLGRTTTDTPAVSLEITDFSRPDRLPRVTVVTCTYSKERMGDLLSLIGSLIEEDEGDIEFVLVVERAKEIVSAALSLLSKSEMNAKIVFSLEPLGISMARNTGISQSRGQYIAFIDDDAVVLPGWKKHLIEDFEENEDIIGVVGRVEPVWERDEDKWFPSEFYWMIGCSAWRGLTGKKVIRFGWGVNMCFRKFVFQETKFRSGFSAGAGELGKTGPVGDDTDFCYRVVEATGMGLLYDPMVVVAHKVYNYRVTPQFTAKYAFWQGYTEAMFAFGRAASARSEPRTYITVRIVRGLLPSLLTDLCHGKKEGLLKLRLLVHSLFFFSAGFVSYNSSRLPRFFSVLL